MKQDNNVWQRHPVSLEIATWQATKLPANTAKRIGARTSRPSACPRVPDLRTLASSSSTRLAPKRVDEEDARVWRSGNSVLRTANVVASITVQEKLMAVGLEKMRLLFPKQTWETATASSPARPPSASLARWWTQPHWQPTSTALFDQRKCFLGTKYHPGQLDGYFEDTPGQILQLLLQIRQRNFLARLFVASQIQKQSSKPWDQHVLSVPGITTLPIPKLQH